jgi:hypothetical protein
MSRRIPACASLQGSWDSGSASFDVSGRAGGGDSSEVVEHDWRRRGDRAGAEHGTMRTRRSRGAAARTREAAKAMSPCVGGWVREGLTGEHVVPCCNNNKSISSGYRKRATIKGPKIIKVQRFYGFEPKSMQISTLNIV